MSKIVFFCIPAHGHTNPTLGVVEELVKRGHEVWYYSYTPFREKIESLGAKFIACDDYDTEQKLEPKDAVRIGRDPLVSMQQELRDMWGINNQTRGKVSCRNACKSIKV